MRHPPPPFDGVILVAKNCKNYCTFLAIENGSEGSFVIRGGRATRLVVIQPISDH
jgi:hypothetical protein